MRIRGEGWQTLAWFVAAFNAAALVWTVALTTAADQPAQRHLLAGMILGLWFYSLIAVFLIWLLSHLRWER